MKNKKNLKKFILKNNFFIKFYFYYFKNNFNKKYNQF